MNSIITLPDLKYWSPFIYLHDTSGYSQATPPEEIPLFFPPQFLLIPVNREWNFSELGLHKHVQDLYP